MAALNDTWIVQPHGPLTEIGDGIWSVEGSIRMPLGRFPRRMTVLVLREGGLAVWSAMTLDAVQMARLDALGPVKFLIVPNQGHRLDIRAWKARYPAALVVTPPGARQVVTEAVPVDATDNVLGDSSIAFERVPGMKADEFALVVTREDGVTLILNDVLASVRHPKGIGANILARLFGFGVRRPRMSRLVRRMYVDDAAAVARRFRTWARMPELRRVIVSHVDVIDDDPAGALERAADDLHASD